MEYVEFENMLSKERDGEDTLKNVTSWTPIQVSHGARHGVTWGRN